MGELTADSRRSESSKAGELKEDLCIAVAKVSDLSREQSEEDSEGTYDRLSKVHLSLCGFPPILARNRHRCLDLVEPQLVEFRLEVMQAERGRLLLCDAVRRR